MKALFTSLFFVILVSTSVAQINAITDTGEEVVLYDDGTWKYLNDSLNKIEEIPVNSTLFQKSEESTFLVRSKRTNVGIWINPKHWNFKKGEEGEPAEFQFQRKGDDLYGMLIAEKISIPIESLKGIALNNARSVAPDIRVIREEYRTVNGLELLMMQMAGTIQGTRFIYYGYYYSSPSGTVQLLTYTGENLFQEYEERIKDFLNGFVEVETID